MQSKVISISIKDRGAILSGGHTANATYWYDTETGGFFPVLNAADSSPLEGLSKA